MKKGHCIGFWKEAACFVAQVPNWEISGTKTQQVPSYFLDLPRRLGNRFGVLQAIQTICVLSKDIS